MISKEKLEELERNMPRDYKKHCPKCNAIQVNLRCDNTIFECGSKIFSYDDTFRQSYECKKREINHE